MLTELILAEVATRVRARAGAPRAVAIARSLFDSRRYELLFVDSALMRGALGLMARFSDKRLSLTDCTSFELYPGGRSEPSTSPGTLGKGGNFREEAFMSSTL